MALFVLTCIDKPDSLQLRLATREAHLAYVARQPGVVRLGGPFLDARGEMAGSMLILELDDRHLAEAFAANDPYQLAGLFGRVELRPWRITVGGLT